MKKYLLLILIVVAGCSKDNPVDGSVSSSNVIYQKDGLVDSLYIEGPVASTSINLDFTNYSKARLTFRYKASVDSVMYRVYKTGSSLWHIPKMSYRTSGNYLQFDTTVSLNGISGGSYTKWLTIFHDSCYFVVRDFKITGVE